jgi:ubiquinone biosynthesis protein COQ9
MRRMTVSLDDEIYLSLVNCAANDARMDMSRLSISRTLQKIMLEELNKLNYYPPRTFGKVGSLVRARMKTLIPNQTGSDPFLAQPTFENASVLS